MGAIKKADKADNAIVQVFGASKTKPQPQTPSIDGSSTTAPRRSCLHKQLRKTKFCMYHVQGVCEFGDACAFAHSCFELQGAPDLRKTRLCKAFAHGNCKDANCPFAHGEEQLRSTDLFYKKSLCMWYDKGRCRNGDQCRFAHGVSELQSWPVRPREFKVQGEPAGSAGIPAPTKRGGKQTTGQNGSKGAATQGRTPAEPDHIPYPKAAAERIAKESITTGTLVPTLPSSMLAPSTTPGTAALDVQPSTGCGLSLTPPPGIDVLEVADRSSARKTLEPMFVETVPLPRHIEQLQRLLAASVDAEPARRFERQLSPVKPNPEPALAAAAQANASPTEGGGMDPALLHAELEKLTQNIAALSLQLNHLGMQTPSFPFPAALQGSTATNQVRANFNTARTTWSPTLTGPTRPARQFQSQFRQFHGHPTGSLDGESAFRPG